jgi:hypothetical protein
MPDGTVSMKRFELLLAENLGDQSHALVEFEGFTVSLAGCDASTLLTTMLKGKETIVGH